MLFRYLHRNSQEVRPHRTRPARADETDCRAARITRMISHIPKIAILSDVSNLPENGTWYHSVLKMIIYTYIYIYTCMCIGTYMHICISVYTYICVHEYVYIYIYVCTYMCIYIYVYTCVYICMCVYIYVCTYMYRYIYIYTRICMCIYQAPAQPRLEEDAREQRGRASSEAGPSGREGAYCRASMISNSVR